LANGGTFMEPYTIESIRDVDQRVVEEHVARPQPAVAETSAFIVTHMLRGVLEEGTGRLSRQMGFTYSAAGKTGTSENYQDAWFVGYTPRLVCGVWVGYDQPKPLGRSAAGIALPLWVAFMQKALALGPEEKWPEPKGLTWKTIDYTSGEAARSGCTQRRKEAFLPGTEPEKMCPLHPGGIIGFFHRLRHK
jgi:penicillin-binding protein 1A